VPSHSVVDIAQSARTLVGQDLGQTSVYVPIDTIVELAISQWWHYGISVLSVGGRTGLTGDGRQ
jgi:hypothetical protein